MRIDEQGPPQSSLKSDIVDDAMETEEQKTPDHSSRSSAADMMAEKSFARQVLMEDVVVGAGQDYVMYPGEEEEMDRCIRAAVLMTEEMREKSTIEYWDQVIISEKQKSGKTAPLMIEKAQYEINKLKASGPLSEEYFKSFYDKTLSSEILNNERIPWTFSEHHAPIAIADRNVNVPPFKVPVFRISVPADSDDPYMDLGLVEERECCWLLLAASRAAHSIVVLDQIRHEHVSWAIEKIEEHNNIATKIICNDETFLSLCTDGSCNDKSLLTADIHCSEAVPQGSLFVMAPSFYLGSFYVFEEPHIEDGMLTEVVGMMVINDYGIARIQKIDHYTSGSSVKNSNYKRLQ